MLNNLTVCCYLSTSPKHIFLNSQKHTKPPALGNQIAHNTTWNIPVLQKDMYVKSASVVGKLGGMGATFDPISTRGQRGYAIPWHARLFTMPILSCICCYICCIRRGHLLQLLRDVKSIMIRDSLLFHFPTVISVGELFRWFVRWHSSIIIVS